MTCVFELFVRFIPDVESVIDPDCEMCCRMTPHLLASLWTHEVRAFICSTRDIIIETGS
jgi:hypothetical protein